MLRFGPAVCAGPLRERQRAGHGRKISQVHRDTIALSGEQGTAWAACQADYVLACVPSIRTNYTVLQEEPTTHTCPSDLLPYTPPPGTPPPTTKHNKHPPPAIDTEKKQPASNWAGLQSQASFSHTTASRLDTVMQHMSALSTPVHSAHTHVNMAWHQGKTAAGAAARRGCACSCACEPGAHESTYIDGSTK